MQCWKKSSFLNLKINSEKTTLDILQQYALHIPHFGLRLPVYTESYIAWLPRFSVTFRITRITFCIIYNSLHKISYILLKFHCNVLMFLKKITNNASSVRIKLTYLWLYMWFTIPCYGNFSLSWCLLAPP